MSRKVASFASIITAPLMTYNFVVSLDDIDSNLSAVVEASSFPTYKFREIVLYTHGEPVSYPGLPESAREWQVTVPESDSGKMYNILVNLYKEIYDEKSGTMKGGKYRNMTVIARDAADKPVFSAILHGVWFKGIDPVQLAATDPSTVWKWPITFNFSWIENTPGTNAGSVDPFAV